MKSKNWKLELLCVNLWPLLFRRIYLGKTEKATEIACSQERWLTQLAVWLAYIKIGGCKGGPNWPFC